MEFISQSLFSIFRINKYTHIRFSNTHCQFWRVLRLNHTASEVYTGRTLCLYMGEYFKNAHIHEMRLFLYD